LQQSPAPLLVPRAAFSVGVSPVTSLEPLEILELTPDYSPIAHFRVACLDAPRPTDLKGEALVSLVD